MKRTDSKVVRKNITLLRAEYNAGKLVYRSGPVTSSKYSFQYNEKGEPVDARTKNYKVLKPEQIIKRRKAADERRLKWLAKNQ